MDKEKLKLEARRDESWAFIRNKTKEMADIISGKATSEETVLTSLSCLSLIIMDLDLYREEFESIDDEIREINKNKDLNSLMIKTNFLIEQMRILSSAKVEIKDKYTSLERLRKQIWNFILKDEDNLIKLKNNFFGPKTNEELALLLRCIGIVCMELNLRDLELTIIKEETYREK